MDACLAYFYPNLCQICGLNRACQSQGYVCSECRESPAHIRLTEPPFCRKCGLLFEGEITQDFDCENCRGQRLHFTWARSSVVATPFLLDVIHRYKYQRHTWFEPFLAGLLTGAMDAALREETFDMIVPLPLHPVKLREREFNQAHRLALAAGRSTGIPVGNGVLERIKPTQTQTALSRSARQKNMAGAFAARKAESARGKRILLVDDILTTGATTSSAAWSLKKAGASEICVWTLARGL